MSTNDVKKKSIHSGHRERMTNKFFKDLDLENFSEHEMVEFLLYSGIPMKDTNAIAHELIEKFGSFSSVFLANPYELMEVKNMTQRAACTISVVLPIARWVESSRLKFPYFLDGHKKSLDYFASFFAHRNVECVYMASLDINDRIIQINKIAGGSATSTAVDPKNIVMTACRNNAVKVVLAHNHPAGTMEPSDQDIYATNTIAIALSAVGIVLVDHLIFTKHGNVSLAERNIIEGSLLNCDRVLGTDYVEEIRARKNIKYPLNNRIYENKLYEKIKKDLET